MVTALNRRSCRVSTLSLAEALDVISELTGMERSHVQHELLRGVIIATNNSVFVL